MTISIAHIFITNTYTNLVKEKRQESLKHFHYYWNPSKPEDVVATAATPAIYPPNLLQSDTRMSGRGGNGRVVSINRFFYRYNVDPWFFVFQSIFVIGFVKLWFCFLFVVIVTRQDD